MFVDRLRFQAICNVALWTAFGIALGVTVYASLSLSSKIDRLVDRVILLEQKPQITFDLGDKKVHINGDRSGSKDQAGQHIGGD